MNFSQVARSHVILIGAFFLSGGGCGSSAAPLSIEMYNPETKQTLTCAARDQLGQAESSVLATAVQECARQLEARGFVRAK